MWETLLSSALLQISAMVEKKDVKDERLEIQYLFDATNVQKFFTDSILTSQTNVNLMRHCRWQNSQTNFLHPVS